MRKEGVQNFQIDWAKFDGDQQQYKKEAEFAKENGKTDNLVCMVVISWRFQYLQRCVASCGYVCMAMHVCMTMYVRQCMYVCMYVCL